MGQAYANGESSVGLIGQTIGHSLSETAQRHPDADALVVAHQDARFSYADLDREVDRVARGLLALGLEAGDRVGIWSPNCAEWVLLQFAAGRVGVIVVMINPAYRANELAYVLRQAGCRVLVSATSFRTSDYRTMIDDVRAELPALEQVVYLGTPDWDKLIADGVAIDDDALEARACDVSFDDTVCIQYTSGTTGSPKGAMLTHHGVVNNGWFIGQRCHYTSADRVCVPVPFYHAFGSVLGNIGCVAHGATIVVPSAGFEPAATLAAVESEGCTSLYGVPTMFIAELALPEFATYDLSSLRTGMMAGSPCPVEVMKRCLTEMHLPELTIAYGMTETLITTQTLTDDPLDARVGTVGRVHPHVEAKVVDPDSGRIVARGVPGELCIRGYSVMRGYWNDPVRTDQTIDAAGWMHTGDLASMDEHGYVNIVGRIKDVVIRGGENIYPREIEEFLYTHPDIIDVQVIGVPDATYGEEVMAWIKPRDGTTIDEAQIQEFCNGHIAHYKIPRYIHITDEFPMTITGKIQKYKMRQTAIELLGLHEAAAIKTA